MREEKGKMIRASEFEKMRGVDELKINESINIEVNNFHTYSVTRINEGFIYENLSENEDTQYRMVFVPDQEQNLFDQVAKDAYLHKLRFNPDIPCDLLAKDALQSAEIFMRERESYLKSKKK